MSVFKLFLHKKDGCTPHRETGVIFEHLPNAWSVIKHPRGCLCLRAPLTARAVGETVEVPFLRISQSQS